MTVPRYIDPSEGQSYWIDRFVRITEFELALGTPRKLIAKLWNVSDWKVVAVYLRTNGHADLAELLADAS